jgi:3-phosphoglycerate kinase
MRESNSILNSIHDALGSPDEDRYWNGSIDSLKYLVRDSALGEKEKKNFLMKIESLIHLGRRKYHVDSVYKSLIAEKINEFSLDFNDLVNSVKDEMGIYPGIFDFYTRQSLSEKELNQYKNELNKKRDEFYKKTKKKPLKPEEEEKELQEYRIKLQNIVKEKLLEKFEGIENVILDLESKILNSYTFDEEYIDRLCRVKSLKSAKSDGIEGKLIVLRIDIEDFQVVYQDIFDTDDNVIGKEIKEINFPNAKETFLKTASSLLDNRAKAVLLLVDFGPKIGVTNPDFSVKYLKDFIEKEQLIEQSIKVIDVDALYELQRHIDLEENSFKENSLLILENLNFLPEECGLEVEKDPFLTTEVGQVQNLKNYSKYKYTKLISLMYDDYSLPASIFVLDSYFSVMKKYPSVIDMQNETRYLGYRLEDKLNKVSNFLSIDSRNALLIIGDSDDINDNSQFDPLNSLLTINALLPRFKKIFIMGHLAMIFIHFLQNEWTLGNYETNPSYHLLIKFILIQAENSNTEIFFPQDGIILNLTEYERFKEGYKYVIQVLNEEVVDQELKDIEDEEENQTIMTHKEPIVIDNYFAYVKKLFKMEKKLQEIEALKLEPEDLLEHEDYQKNKLTNEERLILENYKNNYVNYQIESYLKNFIYNQQTFKPKKILKNELEEREYIENVYRKPINFGNYQNNLEDPIQHLEKTWENVDNKTVKSDLKSSNFYKSDYNNNKSVTAGEEKKLKIVDTNENVILDWGEKTYDKLSSLIAEVKMVMWLGKLSPSPVENLYDNYAKIVRSIYERKNKLKSEYNETLQEEDKKPQDHEQKAKKHLFNIFLKSKTAYENVRRAFLTFMLPAVINLFTQDDKDAESPPDDDQFNYDMNLLIDVAIKGDCHFIDSILRGEHIPGIFLFTSRTIRPFY